jgi:hypothetical protein
MLLETFAFFGITAIIMFAFAEIKAHDGVGIAAAIFLLLLSFWVLLDGLSYQTGTTTSSTSISLLNTTTNETITSISETSTPSYTALSWPFSAFSFKIAFSIILILVSLYALLHYTMFGARKGV